jgi:hypothetical protein
MVGNLLGSIKGFIGKAEQGEIKNLRKDVKDSYIDNQIDGVVELIQSTLYKLRFLK